MPYFVRSEIEKTNYQPGGILDNDTTKWSDYTVRHEIYLCDQCLFGISSLNIPGMLREHGKKQCYTWLNRFYNANREARKRFGGDKELIGVLDDMEFVIDYELV